MIMISVTLACAFDLLLNIIITSWFGDLCATESDRSQQNGSIPRKPAKFLISL